MKDRQALQKPEALSAGIEALEPRIAPALLAGLTTANFIVTFDSADPAEILSSVKIRGLAAGEDIASIDSRAANGLLYGLTKQNTLYTISPYTGIATKVGPAGAPALSLSGKTFGIDFNPTVDRLRVVSDADQNLRINPLTGVVVDGDGVAAGTQPDTALAFAAADANNGLNPNIGEVAYDRNFQGATLTTLFGIDSTVNALVRIGGVDGTPSPNAGAVFTVGILGVDPGPTVGFDVAPDGTAYASLRVAGKTTLYTVNLTTGAATEVGLIKTGATKLDGLTVMPRQELVFGVTQSNRLISFHADDPGRLESAVSLRGMIANETVRGLDFRPANGELYALTSLNRVLTIDPSTGQASQVGAQLDATVFSTGFPVGFDFNPAADRLRLVNTDDDNVRFNPLSTALVTPADTALDYITGDPNDVADPNIVGAAYDRNDNNGATATTLFGIDSTLNNLVRQGAVDGNAADVAGGGSPNGGLLTTIGSLGVDTTDQVGFDISENGTAGVGAALAVMQLSGDTSSKLFSINLNSGLTNQPLGGATLVGTVAGGEVLSAMAIAPATVEFSSSNFSVKEKAGAFATIEVRRTGGGGGTSTVRFDTFDGTALAGFDYTALSQILTFAPGESLKLVKVAILGDTEVDPNETVGLSLAAAGGGNTILGGRGNAVLTIK